MMLEILQRKSVDFQEMMKRKKLELEKKKRHYLRKKNQLGGEKKLDHWNACMEPLLRELDMSEDETKPNLYQKPEIDIFNAPLSTLLRIVFQREEKMREEEALRALAEKEAEATTIEEGRKDKKKRKRRKQSLAMRLGRKSKDDRASVWSRATSEVQIEKPKLQENTLYARREIHTTWTTRPAETPEGTEEPVEIVHIAPVILQPEVQQAIKCELGVHVFMDQPWTIVKRSDILHLLRSKKYSSPLDDYKEAIKAYPEEEILIGRCSVRNPDDFVIALTIEGRTAVLEELKEKHKAQINKIMRDQNFPIREWISLGSEKEIEEENIHYGRPLMSYDCTLNLKSHEQRYKKSFDYEEFYVEIKGPIYNAVKNVEGSVFDKYTQTGPTYRDVVVETPPEIPVNSSTQFTTEMRVLENEEKLQTLELDEELLKQKVNSFFFKVDSLLTYNEEYDLYQDDYEILGGAGEELNMHPTVPYEHFLTMVTFIGTKDRGITTTSWDPNKPGVVAVSYAKDCVKKIGNLSDNSDEDEYSEGDTDDEKFYNSIPTTNPFENVIRKLWISQLNDLDTKLKNQERDRNLYKLASTSVKFMKYARDLRLFQMIQAKKDLKRSPDLEDLNVEDTFDYPLFEGSHEKRKKRVIDINEILQREPTFLKRDYLFSDTFQWKLQAAQMVDPMYLMIKECKEVPERYIKTFLFRELWAGDKWNFGHDLELEAIEINRKFRESGVMVFGKPPIPMHKIFLPGFKNEEYTEPEKVNPWKEIEEFEKKYADEIKRKQNKTAKHKVKDKPRKKRNTGNEFKNKHNSINLPSKKRNRGSKNMNRIENQTDNKQNKIDKYREKSSMRNSKKGRMNSIRISIKSWKNKSVFNMSAKQKKKRHIDNSHELIQELPQCDIGTVFIGYRNDLCTESQEGSKKESVSVLDQNDATNVSLGSDKLKNTNNNKTSFDSNACTRVRKKEEAQLNDFNGNKIPGKKSNSGNIPSNSCPEIILDENLCKKYDVCYPEGIKAIDIPHAVHFFNENPSWGFQPQAIKELKNCLKGIADCERKRLLKQDLEVLSSDSNSEEFYEKDEDEEELDKLELQHYVVIWSIIDDLKPMHRLISPFEVTCASFCPYTSKYIAGGLITGQVVVWELEGYTHKTFEEVDIDKLGDQHGYRHLRKVMSWFKRMNPTERIPISCFSSKKTSHSDRVIDITWLPPNIEILPEKGGRYNLTKSGGFGTLQFLSTSCDGTIKYWGLKSSPTPAPRAPFSVYSLQRRSNFQRPEALKRNPLKYSSLYLRWDPIFQVKLLIPEPAFTAPRFHVTCVSHDEIPYEYQRDVQKPTKDERRQAMGGEYNMSCLHNINLLSEAIIGTIDGVVASVSWQQPAEGQPGLRMVEPDGLPASVTCTYESIHDGPITFIAKQPSKREIFLTSGGHVFGLWTIGKEKPLTWRKYSELIVTYVGWTNFKASTFRVGFSDGTLEVWDLLEDGNEAKMRMAVAEGSIYDLKIPRLPIPRGLIAIVDQRGVLKFFNEPLDYQVDDPDAKNTFFNMIDSETTRKEYMQSLADNWRKEKEKLKKGKEKQTKGLVVESEESNELQGEVKDVERAKVKDVAGCKKFKEELYKWYLRRRGRNAAWLDPAEKLWYSKEEDHMIKTILKNRNISLKDLDNAIRPLTEKEKRESGLAVKMNEIVNMADEIFQNAIREFETPRQYIFKSQVSLEIENMAHDDLQNVWEKVNLYFGPSTKQIDSELEELVKSNNIKKDWTLPEILEKYQEVRDFWNDRRRYLNADQRWVRELVKEEMEKQGLEFSYWINHEDSYLVKKYTRRMENIVELREMYGNDYNPFWDLKESGQKQSRLHGRQFQDYLSEEKNEESDMQVAKFPLGTKVDINLPEGSFYRKYMADENLKWKKPKTAEEMFVTPHFQYHYGEPYLQASDEELAEPPEEKKESAEEIFPWSVPAGEEDEKEELAPLDEIDKEIKTDTAPQVPPTAVETEHKKKKKKEKKKHFVEKPTTKQEKHEDEGHPENVGEAKEDDAQASTDETKEKDSDEKLSTVRFKTEEGRVVQETQGDAKESKMSFGAMVHLRTASTKALRMAIIAMKAKGEEIPDISEIHGYESCSSVSSLSSLESSPDMSLEFDDEESVDIELIPETKEGFKEYFEGPPPRYEPPRRRPHFHAPHEEEETEEWISEEKPEDSAPKLQKPETEKPS